MQKVIKNHKNKIVFAILALFFAVSALNAKNDSATYDEVAHIPAGYSYVTQHDTRINPEHPPLIKNLSGLPLLFMDLNFDTTQPFWTGELPNKWDEGQWAAGRHLLYEAGNDPDKIIFWSRIPIVLLSVLLGWFLYVWGSQWLGTLGGLLVLILYAFDPNILGHNHFVTTDIGVAAFLTFAFYYFLKFIRKPSWKNTVFAGIFLGLLLVTKFSSIVALPVLFGSMIVYALVVKKSETTNFKERLHFIGNYLLKGTAAFVVSMGVVWIVYAVNIYEMPKETFATTIEFFFPAEDENIKTKLTNQTLNTLNQSSITRPLATYLFGPAWMFKRVSGGNGAYFLGEVGNGFTWYFPVVFTLKETIPFLLMASFALAFTAKQIYVSLANRKFKIKIVSFLRGSVVGYTLFGFIILYAFLSIQGGLNIGFRHLFPILPFAYLLIAKKIIEFNKKSHPHTKQLFLGVLIVMLGWQVGTTAFAYPHYTSYFNEIAGGPNKGYQFVTDSNADWGQDLKRLKNWIEKYNTCSEAQSPENCVGFDIPKNEEGKTIEKIRVDYFGGGDIYHYIGEDQADLWWDSKRPIENGWYAISVNFLQGSIYNDKKGEHDNYKWTKNYTPIDQVGTSILIFYVSDK